MPEHQGRRRKQSGLPIRRITALVAALAAIGILVTLPEPDRAASSSQPLRVPPAWSGPATTQTNGALPDGVDYTPRIFVTADTSVGTALSTDGNNLRLVLVAKGAITELRRLSAVNQPQFSGFTVAGDTVVWAESVAPDDTGVRTSLWRANWRTGAKATSVTNATGEPNFYGSQYDLVVHGNRVYWTSIAAGAGITQVRSVTLTGGSARTTRLTGDFTLTAWPWAVNVDGGRGKPVQLVNYADDTRASLATTTLETAACSPVWCRVGVFSEDALTRLELVKPDGSGRRRIAGSEATPTIVDVALVDRYVPLTTDLGRDSDLSGVGLSLYDITTGQTDLVATNVEDVRGSGAMLWWSTAPADVLTWHALDLRTLA